MANRACTWFDILFKWIGIAALVGGILFIFYKYAFKPYFIILKLPLANQLGI